MVLVDRLSRFYKIHLSNCGTAMIEDNVATSTVGKQAIATGKTNS